ncbi:MAG: beta-ketoacyl synthase N-terminal-like domain-containing protein [Planctomycetota bacterium]
MANASAGIVVTGAGLATSLGVGREAVWSAVRQGGVGLGPYRAIEDPAQAERGGGEVPAGDDVNLEGEPRTSAYLRFAVEEALRHAGLVVGESWPYPAERCGLMLGTTLHGMDAAGRMVRRGSAEPLRDFLAPAVAARATEHLPLTGFSATTCSACSSGLGSLLLAATLLRCGELDLVVAGGYDPISEYAYAGFNALRLVDDRLPRPFARDRAGMKVSEGYGIVVMERASDAAARGVSPFLWLRGGGESADAHHLTQPRPDGGGAARAIAAALDGAAADAAEVDLIVAHATGTPDNDAAEVAAYRGVFGDTLADTPVVGLKSRLGHTLGAAGSAELILAGLAMRDGVLPTTATTTNDETDFEGVHVVTGDARPADMSTALNTSLGFGGANTCVVTSRTPGGEASQRAALLPGVREVWVTGVGIVTPDAVGFDAFVEHARSGREPTPGPVPDDAYLQLLQARRVRRLSDYVKLTLAAARLAADDAGLDTLDEPQRDAFTADCAAVLGTAHGSTKHSYAYYRGLVDEGYAAANPMLFAEGVPNAGAAHLSMGLNLRGGCQSIIGSRTAGLDALRLAALRLAGGEGDRAVVCAGEEHDPLVERCYAELGLPTPTAAGAVALVLEAQPAAEARGAHCRGAVGPGSQTNFGRDLRAGVRGVGRLVAKSRDPIIGCGGPGWLGRFEAAGLRRAGVASSRFAGMAEGFSTTPLAAVAAALGGAEPTLVVAADFHGGATGLRVRPAKY